MDKKVLAIVIVAVVFIAAVAVVATNSGNGDKEEKKDGFTVTFDANGGSGTMAPVKGVTGTYTLPECTFTAPEGHSFAGWSLSKAIILPESTTLDVEEDIVVYAMWNDDSDMGVTALVSYLEGFGYDDPVKSAISIVFESGDKKSKLSLDTLSYAYYYGKATMTLSVEGSSDWSYHLGKLGGDETRDYSIFEFTYNGARYSINFYIVDGKDVSGSVDPAPTLTFSTDGKAFMNVILGKA